MYTLSILSVKRDSNKICTEAKWDKKTNKNFRTTTFYYIQNNKKCHVKQSFKKTEVKKKIIVEHKFMATLWRTYIIRNAWHSNFERGAEQKN